jgi:hypothetical protein
MAIAKPVRYLGALSVCLLFFILYEYLRPIPTIQAPGAVVGNGDKIESWDQDPLLQRMDARRVPCAMANLVSSNR